MTNVPELIKSTVSHSGSKRISTSTEQGRNNLEQLTKQPQSQQAVSQYKPPQHYILWFDGRRRSIMVSRMDNFIQDEGLSDRKMLRIAASYLDSVVLQWWTNTARDLEASGVELTYNLFVDNCIKRWGGMNIQERVRSQLDRLRLTKSIGEYNNEFQKLFSHVLGEYSTEAFKIYEYVKGLKLNLQIHAAVIKFETVQKCMAAMTSEDALNTAQQRFQSSIPRPTQQNTTTPRKPFTPSAWLPRKRE